LPNAHEGSIHAPKESLESNTITPTVFYRTLNVEGLEMFYREAGPRDGPTVLLLHGFPSSSHMFRNLIPMLADEYHVVAPDFPGYGESSAPSVNDFDYSYERLATVTEKFTEKLNLSCRRFPTSERHEQGRGSERRRRHGGLDDFRPYDQGQGAAVKANRW
jgi:alpha-beta hydrolase superfamily lysophospholipase